jgi:general secretion pathway protein L
MAMRIWGVDLGAHSVKLCSLLSSFRSFTVESVASARVEAGGETPLLAAQKLALASLLEAPHAKPDAVILSLPGAAAATHVISLPSVDAKRLEQTLGFEVESLIPFDLTDVAYDHVSLGQSDGKSHLLVGVVRKGAFKDVLAAMDELGLDPRTVTLGQVAYQSLFPTLAPPLENLEAILDLGHERCCIAFREEGKLVFGRSFDGGGASLTRAIARDLSRQGTARVIAGGRGRCPGRAARPRVAADPSRDPPDPEAGGGALPASPGEALDHRRHLPAPRSRRAPGTRI